MKYWEIDKLIAVNVLGCLETPSVWFKDYDTQKLYYHVGGSPKSEEVSLIEYNGEGWQQYHFSPSTSIQDAWKVVEKMDKVKIESFEDGYRVDILEYDSFKGTFPISHTEYGDTAQMTICKAALQTVGINI